MSDWQDISTAPKDGTRILAVVRFDNGLSTDDAVDIAYWVDFNGGGWVRHLVGEPTHWMPLPSPPTEVEPC